MLYKYLAEKTSANQLGGANMAQFPRRLADKLALGHTILNAINNNPAIFVNPPYDPAPINAALSTAEAAIAQNEADKATEALSAEAASDAVDVLATILLDTWKQARVDFSDNEEAKAMLGDTTSTPRTGVPGQVREFKITRQGPGTAQYEFVQPARSAEHGDARIYKILYRTADSEGVLPDWSLATVVPVFNKDGSLSNLPNGVTIELTVVASNTNGDGIMSNVETVVL